MSPPRSPMLVAPRTRQRFGVLVLGLAAFVLVMSVGSPHALAVFPENFDEATGPNYAVPFTGDMLYTLSGGSSGGDINGNVHQNAYILSNFGTEITNDQSGTGYFLYDQTVVDGTPSYAGEVWGTVALVPVTPGTEYVFSFYLTNRDNISPAEIEPHINGISIGSAVSANGFFADGNAADKWQKFSFTWNSGAATTADLSLWNLRATGAGNDFGIDGISMDQVPEPSSLALAALGFAALAAWRLRRH